MANHHQIAFWIDTDNQLNLYYEDSLSGEYDTWLIHDNGGWHKSTYNDEKDQIEWPDDTVDIASELVKLLNALNGKG